MIFENNNRTDLYLTGDIGFDVSARKFIEELKTVTTPFLVVHIDSLGGSTLDSISIYNALKDFDGTKTAIIDGVAMSAASYILMAFDKIIAKENSLIMLHNPLVEHCAGNANDLTKVVDTLNSLTEIYVDAYAKRTGKTTEEIKAILDAETYFTANEALELNLIDEIETTSNATILAKDILTQAVQTRLVACKNKHFMNTEEILKRYKTDEAKEQFLKSLENVKLSDYEGNFTARDWFEGKALPSLKKHIPSERELRNLRFLPISNIEREDKKLEKLTTKERNAITTYTGDAHRDINDGLRKGNLISKWYDCVKNIRSGISKGKLTRDTKLYRNLNPLSWMCKDETLLKDFLSGNLDEEGIDLLDSVLKDVIGETVNDPAFTSTSYDGYKHIFGPIRCEVLVPKNSSALSLKTISKYPNENEILLQSDLVFEIKDVMIEKRGKHNGILFTLEVIKEKKYD